MMTLTNRALNQFLAILPKERVTRERSRVIVHAEVGDAVWYARGDLWITAAPDFEAAQRSGALGHTLH